MARPLSSAARAKMLSAAQRIILADGLEACTVDSVARESEVAKTTIYRHFTNIDELVLAAIDEMITEVGTPDTGALRTDLAAVIYGFRAILEHPTARKTWATMLSRALADDEFASLYARAQDVRHVSLKRVLQRAMARGEVDPEIDLTTAMYFTQGPFVAKRLIELDPLTDDDVEAFIDLVVRALAPR